MEQDRPVPQLQPHSKTINIIVIDQSGIEVQFKIKETSKMEKMFTAFCGRTGLDFKSVRFLYDGNRISPDSTPKSLGMQDGDTIDAVLTQTGG